MYSKNKIIVNPGIEHNVKSEMMSPPPYRTSKHYEEQLNIECIRQHSLNDAIRMASQVNMKHDANGCCQCDVVADYYVTTLRYAKEHEPIHCNSDLFELIWQMTNLILAHRETSKYQYIPWFDLVTIELWDLAKQLKEESYECDLHISTTEAPKRRSIDSVQSDTTTVTDEDDEENYRRAIRITIYNCRALVYEQSNDLNQAIIYYRKCASVRPTPFEPQQHLQQSALNAMHRLISQTSTNQIKTPVNSTFSISSSESSVSTSKSTLMTCNNCAIEKMFMPVCSRCKSQSYCSVRCIRAHQSVHSQTCTPPSI